ncbi:hypothetical protein TWF173_005130 [Orbilia oligospora]|nr:hypothetical protein TWF173_005130 [Orbilia oligospora]
MSTAFNRVVEAVGLVNGCLDMVIKLNQLLQQWKIIGGDIDNEDHEGLVPDVPPGPGLAARAIAGGHRLIRVMLNAPWVGVRMPLIGFAF